MRRSSWFVLLVLGLLPACEGSRGCGSSVPTASAPASAPAPAAAALEPRYVGKWWVIVHTSPVAGEGADVLAKLQSLDLPTEPVRLSTTAFVNLRPCLEVLVARAFADKAGAGAFQKELARRGVEAYVKNAGALAPDRPARQATCGSKPGTEARRAMPFLVENHVGRSFVLLGPAPDSSGLTPVDETRRVWRAELARDPEGRAAPGAVFDVYSAAGAERSCTVAGVVKLHRDVPHFAYLQQQETPPEAPGCGDTSFVFAELDCVLGAPDEEARWFVLPQGTPSPRFYEELPASAAEGLPAGFLEDEEAALRASAERTQDLSTLRREAKEAQTEVFEQVKGRVFSLAGRHVVVTTAEFSWGFGDCGQGETVYFSRVGVVEPDGRRRTLRGLTRELKGLQGVLDLEGDGKVELLYRGDRFGRSTWLVREDGSEVARSEIRTCDSGC